MSDNILTDLAIYARRTANEARQHADRARELRATDPMENCFGASEATAQQYRQLHAAKVEAETALARVKKERAKVAERGYMLARDDEELRDREFTMTHGKLIAAAYQAGLVTDSTD